MADSDKQQAAARGSLVPAWSTVEQAWNLELLCQDLGTIKGRLKRPGGPRVALSPTEITLLRGLLFGASPRMIAREMGRQKGGIKTDLSKTIYRYLKTLLDYGGGSRYPREQVLELLRERGYGRVNDHRDGQPRQSLALETIRQVLPAGAAILCGRQRELKQLGDWLHCSQGSCHISVEGPGGIGKTALVRQALVQFFGDGGGRGGTGGLASGDDGVGSAGIRFAYGPAVHQVLTSTGAIAEVSGPQTLSQVLMGLADGLGFAGGNGSAGQTVEGWRWRQGFNRYLGQQSTVVFIDNGEALDRASLEQWIAQLPQTVKVIVASRDRLVLDRRLVLSPLLGDSVERLIRQGAEQRGVVLAAGQQRSLAAMTQGIPLIAIHGLVRLSVGCPVGAVLAELESPTGGVIGVCVAPVMDRLWRSPATRALLMALVRFPAGGMVPAAYRVAGLTGAEADQGWATLMGHHLLQRYGNRWGLWPVARRYGQWLEEQALDSDLGAAITAQMDQRWLAWGQDWLARYGNRDRSEWRNYGPINEQWDNLEMLLDWCMASDRPAELWGLWEWLRGATQFQGRHQIRIRWMAWAGEVFRARGLVDLAAAADFDLGFTYSNGDHPESLAMARTCFERAWALRDQCSLQVQADLIVNQCRVAVRQGRETDAQGWLTTGQEFLAAHPTCPEMIGARMEIQLSYTLGEMHFHGGRFDQAEEHYGRSQELAIALGWKRAEILSDGWLGDIAFRLGRWEEAETKLTRTIRQAEARDDRRCLALCRKNLAELAIAQGRPKRATFLARKALQGFRALDMTQEFDDSMELLKELSYPLENLQILWDDEIG